MSQLRPHRRAKPQAKSHARLRDHSAPGADARAHTRIEQVRTVLGEVLQWQYPADAVLSHWFKAHPYLGARDRGEVANAVFDVLRHLRRYRHYAQSGTGAATRRLAILGLVASLPQDHTEALVQTLEGKERHWLRQVQTIALDSLPAAVRDSLPDWLAQQLQTLDDAPALMQALNYPAPLDLRVNPLKTTREAVLAQLQGDAFAACRAQAMPYSPWGIRVQGHPPVNRWTLFTRGEIEIQDEGSQLLALLVGAKRGEMVIDYCAGAGGKTLLLGALMRSSGILYAFEVAAGRLARAKPRLARSGLSNVHPVVIARKNDPRVARLHGKAHRVLVDAPCSGTGTLRRNPDLKWRTDPGGLTSCCQSRRRFCTTLRAVCDPAGGWCTPHAACCHRKTKVRSSNFWPRIPNLPCVMSGRCWANAAPIWACATIICACARMCTAPTDFSPR